MFGKVSPVNILIKEPAFIKKVSEHSSDISELVYFVGWLLQLWLLFKYLKTINSQSFANLKLKFIVKCIFWIESIKMLSKLIKEIGN